MENEIKNKEDGMIIKNKKAIPLTAILSDEQRNNIPAGSYLIVDGKLIPNKKKKTEKEIKK